MCVHVSTCFLRRFGDRILSVDGHNFHDISRKDAAEVLKSCDKLTVTMEISRVCSKMKPHALVRNVQFLCRCPANIVEAL